jgi:hypothetical protein
MQTPHLVIDGKIKRCSVCGMPFSQDHEDSLAETFKEHVQSFHNPGQTKEDASQAAARVVKEATEDR